MVFRYGKFVIHANVIYIYFGEAITYFCTKILSIALFNFLMFLNSDFLFYSQILMIIAHYESVSFHSCMRPE